MKVGSAPSELEIVLMLLIENGPMTQGQLAAAAGRKLEYGIDCAMFRDEVRSYRCGRYTYYWFSKDQHVHEISRRPSKA